MEPRTTWRLGICHKNYTTHQHISFVFSLVEVWFPPPVLHKVNYCKFGRWKSKHGRELWEDVCHWFICMWMVTSPTTNFYLKPHSVHHSHTTRHMRAIFFPLQLEKPSDVILSRKAGAFQLSLKFMEVVWDREAYVWCLYTNTSEACHHHPWMKIQSGIN